MGPVRGLVVSIKKYMSTITVELFKPHTGQKSIVEGFADSQHKYCTVSCGRQWGKTLLSLNLLLYWALKEDEIEIGWISPTYRQAKKVAEELNKNMHQLVESFNKSDMVIYLINGTLIRFLSGDSKDSIRGYSFDYLIVDECGYIPDSVIQEAILPTLTVKGKKSLWISTPKGKQGFFFTQYLKGLEPNDSYISFNGISSDNPYADIDFIEDQRKSLPATVFSQEFEGGFVDSSNDVFVGVDRVSVVDAFVVDSKQDAFIGIDTGLTDDFSVLTIISSIGRVLWVETVNNLPLQNIAQKFVSIMERYNVVGGYIECNGIGQAMADQILPKNRRVRKFFMTQDKKTEVVRKLIADIESTNIELPTKDLLPALHTELATYTYKMSSNGKLSFSHIAGGKDDHIDSLMLANYSRVQFMDRKPIRVKGIKPKFN